VPEESFVPKAREETAELVRNSSRPVRAIIDQQSDVSQLLKTTARSIDDLESEIRQVREKKREFKLIFVTTINTITAQLLRMQEGDQEGIHPSNTSHPLSQSAILHITIT